MTNGYSLRFEYQPHYLFAIVEGEVDTVAISLAYWSEIAAECRRHHASRLLVLEKITAKSNSDDAGTVIAELPNMFGDMRIAFVDTTESVDVLVHAEIEARKAGLVSHVFGSLEAAKQWLLRDLDQDVRAGARASR